MHKVSVTTPHRRATVAVQRHADHHIPQPQACTLRGEYELPLSVTVSQGAVMAVSPSFGPQAKGCSTSSTNSFASSSLARSAAAAAAAMLPAGEPGESCDQYTGWASLLYKHVIPVSRSASRLPGCLGYPLGTRKYPRQALSGNLGIQRGTASSFCAALMLLPATSGSKDRFKEK